jgi:hypothetical protein
MVSRAPATRDNHPEPIRARGVDLILELGAGILDEECRDQPDREQ